MFIIHFFGLEILKSTFKEISALVNAGVKEKIGFSFIRNLTIKYKEQRS